MSNILQSSGCANLRDQSKKYMSVEKEESSGETKSLTSTWLKSYRKSQKEKKKKKDNKRKRKKTLKGRTVYAGNKTWELKNPEAIRKEL